MKIYIAGPMTGLPKYNREAFFEKEKELLALGYQPVHTSDLPDGKPYEWYIRESIKRMLDCEGIYLLRGWEKSRGVMEFELPLATKLGFKVFAEDDEDFMGVTD